MSCRNLQIGLWVRLCRVLVSSVSLERTKLGFKRDSKTHTILPGEAC